jgi:hypothetical protein
MPLVRDSQAPASPAGTLPGEEHMSTKLTRELESFGALWEGGYFEGDPLDPFAKSAFNEFGFMSILHATYLRCIKPYVNSNTVSLEIGPGRGAWTKALLPSKEVYVLDALPEEHNRFFEYLGYPGNVKYLQVRDFECSVLPDDHFNFMFSFGCFCHVSFAGITQYASNTFAKLKSGSDCFWMIADYDKYNWAVEHLGNYLKIQQPGMPTRKHSPLKKDEDDEPRPGRWYHAGIDRTCSMLQDVGYQIVDPDVGTNLRDPIIYFRKL